MNMLKVNDVSQILKISKLKVYKMIKSGELPHIRVGHSIRILEEDLLKWVEETKTKNVKSL